MYLFGYINYLFENSVIIIILYIKAEIRFLLFLLSIFILGKRLEYIKQWQKENKERRIKLSVSFNAETDRCYQNAFLTVFCKEKNVDLYFMGRLIRKQSEQPSNSCLLTIE